MTKSLVLASSILLLSANAAYAAKALPGYSHSSGNKTIQTRMVDTKERAYSLGLQKLQDLKKLKSGRELSDIIGLNLDTVKERDSVTLEGGAFITVQELMNEQGNIVYKGKVNIIYHYSYKIDSN